MEITAYSKNGDIKPLTIEEIEKAIQSEEDAIWIDMTNPSSSDVEMLQSTFHLHPLAIEDIQNQEQRPKAEEFSDHLFIILNPVKLEQDELAGRELGIFVGKNYVITAHAKPEPIVGEAQQRIDPTRIPFAISSTYLLYVLLDTVVDSYLPMLEKIEDEIDALGNRMIVEPESDMQARLFELKRSLNLLWWIVMPCFDIVSTLTQHELVFVDERSKYYLRDVEDHLRRITDMIQISRDSVNGLINLYVSAVSNKLNVAVNRLTIFTIIIGLLAVISGFYGMNFEHIWPPQNAEWSVPFVLAGMIALTIVTNFILRQNK